MLCTDAFEFFRCNLPHIPGNYLEFGVFDGDGLRALALLYPDRHFYGIDPFIEDGNTWPTSGVSQGQAMVAQRQNAIKNTNGVPNVSLYIETSKEFCQRFNPDDHSDIDALGLGLIFVDGSHHYTDVKNDCEFSALALRSGGVVVFDDLFLPDVSHAVNEFKISMEHRISSIERIGGAVLAIRLKP